MAKHDGLMVAILEGMKKKGEEAPEEDFDVEEAGGDDYSVGYDSAVEEMFSAFDSKDVSGFKEALKSFIELCVDEDEGSTEEI
tara:strand:+ start:706 stop:954 length:249 start_codon:yes stop_codon:yes gene_type:complete